MLLSGIDREIRSNDRGEYWVILLPGTYKIRASHTNKYGNVFCEKEVIVTKYLGEGAKVEDLILKPRYVYEDCFLPYSIIFHFVDIPHHST